MAFTAVLTTTESPRAGRLPIAGARACGLDLAFRRRLLG
jgi:hypothetical protein